VPLANVDGMTNAPLDTPFDDSSDTGVRRITAHSIEDLLALAPVVLGFWPHDSVVMFTFGSPLPFHAHLRLPERVSTQDLREVEETMLTPAVTHDVAAVVLLVYGHRERVVKAVHRALRAGTRRRGIDLVGCIWADGERYQVLSGLKGSGGPVPYDVGHHPYVVEAVVEGRLAFASREEMVASIEPDPAACSEVTAALRRLGLGDDGPDADDEGTAEWAERLVMGRVELGEPPMGDELARLAWAVQAISARDAVWALIGRGTARRHESLWAAVLRQTPEHLVPPVADLLAFSAWQAGDGAMAWAAVDRARRARPDDRMAGMIADLLDRAIPPQAWPAS